MLCFLASVLGVSRVYTLPKIERSPISWIKSLVGITPNECYGKLFLPTDYILSKRFLPQCLH